MDTQASKQQQIVVEQKQENSQLRMIIFNLPGNVYWKNRKHHYLGANRGLLKLIGAVSQSQLINKTIYDFADKKLADTITQIDEQVMMAGEEKAIEEIGFDAAGNTAVYETRKIPLFGDDKEVVGLIGISFDITAEKRAEVLAKEKEIAHKTIKLLKTMAASMAHELRNPIAGTKRMFSDIFQKIAKSIHALTKSTFDKKDIPAIEQRLLASVKHTQNGMRFVDTALALMSVQLN